MGLSRRSLLVSGLASAGLGTARGQDDEAAARLLQRGEMVAVFRHANAPGAYDPPELRLDDCATQRNLDDEGRAQARRLGDWFRRHGLVPAAVRSSPWCRCLDTARGAFGQAQAWAELGSPARSAAQARADQVRRLDASVAGLRGRAGVFEVWVTHNFVIADLCGVSTASAEGVLLRGDADGKPSVVARLGPF